jgi:hypothetical protein
MTINYHLAELAQKIFTPDVSSRKQSLMRSRGFYERFLKLLDSYDLLSRPDAKLYESYTEDKQNFSTVSTKDAAARRDIKIARFREEKELKRKLEVHLTILLLNMMCTKLTSYPSICNRTPSLRSRMSKWFGT